VGTAGSACRGANPGDNAKVNQRDRDKTAPTADQRKDKSDRELAREVRRVSVTDKSLSSYVHNI
jgi:hypothetical protein